MNHTADKYEDMIPSYLNGRLADEEKQAFLHQLETDQYLKIQVEEFSNIKESCSGLSDALPKPSKEIFSKIIERVESSENEHKTNVRSDDLQPPFYKKLTDFFRVPEVAWSLTVLQAAVIVFLVYYEPALSEYETLSSPPVSVQSEHIEFNIVFDESAMEKQIRHLLHSTGAEIINGPEENGLYTISVRNQKDNTRFLEQLKQSPFVKFVQKRM